MKSITEGINEAVKEMKDMDKTELFDKFLELHEDNVVMSSPTRVSWKKTKERIQEKGIEYSAWLYYWRMAEGNPLDDRSCIFASIEWQIKEEKRLRKLMAERQKELRESKVD